MSEVPLTLGTAGHVDHGKTALVRALTGVDTDRLPQERARGLTIEPGFAELTLPSGRRASLVDVPGHERFVRHMVAGASGVDGYLLCVAADDGVMPQTREHLDVLGLLGVERGVVAVTRADLADPGAAATAAAELAGPGTPVVPVSAVTGAGLPALRAALEALVAGLERRTAGGPARLYVDRVFAIPGAGTVVTGTHWGEPLAPGDRVRVLPGGARGRVRAVQSHDRPRERADGGRVALNLAGVPREQTPRGSCVVAAAEAWAPSERLDVALAWLPSAGASLRTRRRLQAFLGTAEAPATCVLLDDDALEPGARGYAQLRLERPLVARAGDRVVLRSSERRTVGGATVLDADPPRHGRGSGAAARLAVLEDGDPVARAALALSEAAGRGVPAREIDPAAAAEAGAALLPGGVALDGAVAARARAAVLAAVGGEGAPAATVAAASGLTGAAAEGLVEWLVADCVLLRDGPRLRPPGAPRAPAGAARLLEALAEAGLRPPPPGELASRAGLEEPELGAVLAALTADGRAVEAGGGLWLHAGAAAAARESAVAALARGPMTIAELRDLWGVSRAHALALAAHLDREGVTRREGERRVLRRGAQRA